MPEKAISALRHLTSFSVSLLVIATLYFGRDLLLPFAVAALFTFLLAPVVSFLQKFMPRVAAVIVTVLISLTGVFALGFIVGVQLEDLGSNLPKYQENVERKLSTLSETFESLESRFSSGSNTDSPAPPPSIALKEPGELTAVRDPNQPIPVQIVSERDPFEMMMQVAGPILDPLGNLAVVMVLVLFMLIYLEDLRDRFVRLLAGRDVTVTTQAVSDVSSRISKYLLMTLVVNVTYGIPVGLGLHFIGLPNAFLWGLLATFLRFIPYLGPWIAAALPLALSVAIAPDWSLTLQTLGVFLVLELVSNNVIEPMVYGSRTGLSPLAIIVSAIFWTWIWGTVGLLLSVPMTLILVVSGRYVPQLRFLHTLLGDEPALTPDVRFYQRLVAGDPDEVYRIAEEYLEQRPLPEMYDGVVVPALRSLSFDEASGRVNALLADKIRGQVEELIEDLPELSEKTAKRRAKNTQAARADIEVEGFEQLDKLRAEQQGDVEGQSIKGRMLFIPAADECDAAVAPLLKDLMRPFNVEVRVLLPSTLNSETVRAVMEDKATVVLIGGFPSGSIARTRRLMLSLQDSNKSLIAGIWDAEVQLITASEEQSPRRRFGLPRRPKSQPTILSQVVSSQSQPDLGVNGQRLKEAGALEVVHSLTEASQAVVRLLHRKQLGIKDI